MHHTNHAGNRQTVSPTAGQPGSMADQLAIVEAYLSLPPYLNEDRRWRVARRMVLSHARGDLERAAKAVRDHAVRATNAVKASLTLEVLDAIRGVAS